MSARGCLVCDAPVDCDPGYPTDVRVVCPRCVAERSRVLEILRQEAIVAVRAIGCTCDPEPTMRLTERGFGAYDLPAWISEHGDGCRVIR